MGDTKKNIAIVINSLKSGGAEKQSILLANSLATRYNVMYVVIDKRHTVDKLYKLLNVHECEVVLLNGFSIKSILTVSKLLKKRKVSHLFAFLTMSTVFGAIAGKLGKVRYVYGSVRNSRLPKFKTLIELFFANFVTYKTIHNSYSGEAFFKNKGMKNTEVIPNCYINILEPDQKKAQEPVKIVSVGRFVAQKDYTTALKAIFLLHTENINFEYHIVGWGELENEIRDLISKLGIGSCVKIHINPPNVADILHSSDVFLLTSLFEGTSNAVMEALDNSLPVVATCAGDNDMLVKDGINGYLCEIGDSDSIAERLLKLCSNYDLRNQMGIAGNHRLRANYSEDAFRARYEKLIEIAENIQK